MTWINLYVRLPCVHFVSTSTLLNTSQHALVLNCRESISHARPELWFQFHKYSGWGTGRETALRDRTRFYQLQKWIPDSCSRLNSYRRLARKYPYIMDEEFCSAFIFSFTCKYIGCSLSWGWMLTGFSDICTSITLHLYKNQPNLGRRRNEWKSFTMDIELIRLYN